MTWPVYVPSKSRQETATTCRYLEASHVPYYLCVLPEQAREYSILYPQANILPKQAHGMTIGEVRNLLLDHAREASYRWIWMIDDDVSAVRRHTHAYASTICDATVLRVIQDVVLSLPSVLVSLGNSAVSWMRGEWSASSKRYSLNCAPNCFIAMDVQAIAPLRYRHMFMYEDMDLAIRLLMQGHYTARLFEYTFDTPKSGVKSGGLQDVYDAGVDDFVRDFCKQYPGIITAKRDTVGRLKPVFNTHLFRVRKQHASSTQ